MIPSEFIRKWSDSRLRERQASQSHFNDLCALLGEPTPTEDDPLGERYCFERGAEKVGGGDGWADVWRKGCFGWEYKGKHRDLNAALRQLQAYALDLQNPPYLVVSDMERIIVHTNWTNTVSQKLVFTLDDLHEPQKLATLKLVFEGSESLKPKISPQELTAKVAQRFGALGRRLQERKDAEGRPLHDPRAIAHFLNRLVFCMFAEDAELLPKGLFTRLCRGAERRPASEAPATFAALFVAMQKGGMFGADIIRWFNGGLFDDAPTLPLERPDIKLIGDTAAEHDWSEIDPAVFGNLFEEALKATRERPALGAHYTDRDKILKIVDPVIVRPLTAEWEGVYANIKDLLAEVVSSDVARRAVIDQIAQKLSPADADLLNASELTRTREDKKNLELFGGIGARQLPGMAQTAMRSAQPKLDAIAKARDVASDAAAARLETFLARLDTFRVLDPACGSGNFLYVALHALKDIERRALVDAERLGLPIPAPRVGLACVRGIEIDAYAAELARVTLWIGDLQWNAKNNYTGLAEPILSTLDQIENRDALLNSDGTEADWPTVDAIVGNPPFLGGSKIVSKLGLVKKQALRTLFSRRIRGDGDFYAYWFDKAARYISSGKATRAGLISKNTFIQQSNRSVLQLIDKNLEIFSVWTRMPWLNEGAAVEVNFICFGKPTGISHVNGKVTTRINWRLESEEGDPFRGGVANIIMENGGVCFNGVKRNGPFDISATEAEKFLILPTNPNGRQNSDVLHPYMNGDDLTGRPRGRWLIDFGDGSREEDISLYEAPYEYAHATVRVKRADAPTDKLRDIWWEFEGLRKAMRSRLAPLAHYFALSEKSHQYAWRILDARIIPDNRLIVVAREDFTTFGFLQSRFQERWMERTGALLESRRCYTPSTTFETFPFPEGLTPNIPAAHYAADPRAIAIAEAAADLNAKREAWLNPPELIRIEPEVVPGYPDRILPKDEAAAVLLKTRTLTNLYNQRPTWLDQAHLRLDASVAKAYGWAGDLSDDDLLVNLFALNQERARAGR